MIQFLYSFENLIILIFLVGLWAKRKLIGRYYGAALIVLFARFAIRTNTLLYEPKGHQTISDFLGQPWLMQLFNLVAITMLFAELILGSECWRVARVNKRRVLLGHAPINLRRKSK